MGKDKLSSDQYLLLIEITIFLLGSVAVLLVAYFFGPVIFDRGAAIWQRLLALGLASLTAWLVIKQRGWIREFWNDLRHWRS